MHHGVAVCRSAPLVNYILYAFAVDFLHYRDLGTAKFWIGYLPFDILVIADPLLWGAAILLWAERQVVALYRSGRLSSGGDAGTSRQQ
jgi:hypothetical protein